MNPPKPVKRRRWADATANEKILSVSTLSGYRGTVGDPKGAQYDFLLDVPDEALGQAVLDCLARSRFLDTPELRAELYPVEAVLSDARAWTERLMAFGAYKTKSALFRRMMKVSIEEEDGKLTFSPWHHVRSDSWDEGQLTAADNVLASMEDPPAALGAALRVALGRCT
ncbi:MAG: contact-dependent growth inhibition system immunity protein [Lysobacterales bacterium]